MGFKVIKKQAQEKQFCDYVQNKIDIAKDYNTTYELTDQDKRIQTLYDDNTLKIRENVKSLSRVKALEDGQEHLVINKDVIFMDKITGMYKDRYSVQEGITELPLEVTNEDGVTETTQVKLDYNIPFTKAKVLEAMRKAGSRTVRLRFYDGPETGNRKLSDTPVVGNLDFFINSTWEELLLGKELKVVSSRLNRLDEVRKDANNNNIITTTDNDTNKPEEQINIVEEKLEIPEQKTVTGTGGGREAGQIVKLKVSNAPQSSTNNKKD